MNKGKENQNTVGGGKNTKIAHPTSGENAFGYLHETLSRGDTLPAGPIILKVGQHRGPNRGFGLNHIWDEHQDDIIKIGYDSAEKAIQYVADIIQPGMPVHCEFNDMRGNHRPAVLRSRKGSVILELKQDGAGNHEYSVITAYPNKNVHGTRVGVVHAAAEADDEQ